MKIHAFKVEKNDGSDDLNDVLKAIDAEQDLEKRMRLISQSEVRVDSIEYNGGLWYLDFVKFRATQGPGKARRKAQVEGFAFAKGESFGEETAAMYDPHTGYMLVQYNHAGVRGGTIERYLSEYEERSNNVYTFCPKFDTDTERRLLKKAIKKKLSFKIDVTEMDAEDIKRGVALSDAVALGRDCEAGMVTIELAAGGDKRNGLRGTVAAKLTALKDLASRNPAAVKSLKVSGKNDVDDAVEVLDLLKQRLYIQFDDIRPGADLRLPLAERWKGLDRARNGWKKLLK
ncbi:MAG: DUF6731 family protein [Halopseudomonas sp.]|uniref:DUF6731 family protein n=1 Tax=Halopseudomonas sp. TaxID=2901191 RepID=UPI003002A0A3